ncbi:MAG: hypothetical protein IJB37_03400, partial [Peptococcaceae bacterium]|nr:hypothetical protein [Peptococcaceae bacterium]
MREDYLPRIVDSILEERLEAVGAVLIAGPKWCGKTTTAEQHAKSILKLQDPDKTAGYLKTAEIKPSLLLQGEIYPFGDESVLVLDLNGQYVYYFENLRDAFWGNGSLLNSWSRN